MYKASAMIVVTSLLILLVIPSSGEVYLTREKAIKIVLPKSKEVVEERHTLTQEQKKRVEKKLNRQLKEKSFTFILGKTDGKIDGYAVIHEEIGKELPITFIVGITPDGKARDVAIMVFRESRGSEVKNKRFLSQYRGKKASDPIAVNKDIKHVTGATLSCIAVSNGVKKVLAVWEEIYKGESP